MYAASAVVFEFLSSLAQDFIEGCRKPKDAHATASFLSSLAQDFIEGYSDITIHHVLVIFLSSLAQDFIEGCDMTQWRRNTQYIPELSSSGLH